MANWLRMVASIGALLLSRGWGFSRRFVFIAFLRNLARGWRLLGETRIISCGVDDYCSELYMPSVFLSHWGSMGIISSGIDPHSRRVGAAPPGILAVDFWSGGLKVCALPFPFAKRFGLLVANFDIPKKKALIKVQTYETILARYCLDCYYFHSLLCAIDIYR